MTDVRVALLSSCTVELLPKPLTAALEDRGFRASLWTGSFGQYRQDILGPASPLYAFAPEFILLYLDGEDLFQPLLENPFSFDAASRRALGVAAAAELESLLATLAERLPGATVLVNTAALPPLNAVSTLEYNSAYGLHEAVESYNAALGRFANAMRSVAVVDTAALMAWIGYSRWFDARLWCLARSRWSREAAQALAARYVSAICGRAGRVSKCVVLDLDNTLWGGIIGEDGMAGIRLGEEGIGRAFVEFQMELLNLSRKGILLAICSKNNPDDALQVIRSHPSMRLREEHFAAMRINWDDKASNLRGLAEELNIGLDTFVFLDDNPVERSWVRQALPEVFVPEWPRDPGEYKRALLDLAVRRFHQFAITAEDRKRGEIYQAQAERRKLQSSTSSMEDFYRQLEMRAKIGPADAFTIPRVAQLTQKTNQFNLTTRRYTEADIAALSRSPEHAVYWLDLADRFGPNGIVGVLILRRVAEGTWLIDTFLLSCRIMGRTAENAFLAVVADQIGAKKLIGEYRPTAKNAPVAQLYPALGFVPVREEGESRFWELDLQTNSLAAPAWIEVTLARGTAQAV